MMARLASECRSHVLAAGSSAGQLIAQPGTQPGCVPGLRSGLCNELACTAAMACIPGCAMSWPALLPAALTRDQDSLASPRCSQKMVPLRAV